MHCRSLLSENTGQIAIRHLNTKCMQIELEFKFLNQSLKIRTSFNVPNNDLGQAVHTCVSQA